MISQISSPNSLSSVCDPKSAPSVSTQREGPTRMQKPFSSRAGSSVSGSTRTIACFLRRANLANVPSCPTAPAPNSLWLMLNSDPFYDSSSVRLARSPKRERTHPFGRSEELANRIDSEAIAELVPDVRTAAVAVGHANTVLLVERRRRNGELRAIMSQLRLPSLNVLLRIRTSERTR